MDAPPEEPILIECAFQGDQEAFAVLFHRYYAMIHALAYRLCLGQSEAQDVAQETFIRAARSLGAFAVTDKATGFRSWLCRIALNAARDHLRRRQRRKSLVDEIASRQAREGRAEVDPSAEIEMALAALPEDLRRAVILVFYESMSHAQAAALLGCAETTVSWRIFRAKRLLRKRLVGPGRHHTDEL